jgi:hypothetical protein
VNAYTLARIDRKTLALHDGKKRLAERLKGMCFSRRARGSYSRSQTMGADEPEQLFRAGGPNLPLHSRITLSKINQTSVTFRSPRPGISFSMAPVYQGFRVFDSRGVTSFVSK